MRHSKPPVLWLLVILAGCRPEKPAQRQPVVADTQTLQAALPAERAGVATGAKPEAELATQTAAPPPTKPVEPKKARDGAPYLAEKPRKWQSTSGTFSTEAVLIRVPAKGALLQKKDGRLVTVPVNKLSQTDRDYILKTILDGKVISIADGDTLTVLDDAKASHKIRFEGIDAPESGQAFGTQSKQALSSKVFNQIVQVRTTGIDKYKRTLGHVYLDNRWINEELVSEGWAWHFLEYSKSEYLAAAEFHARMAKLGLWADSQTPIAPWVFRHPPVAAPVAGRVSLPTQTVQETVYITNTGKKYHSAGCRYLAKSSIPISLDAANARGYTACKVCGGSPTRTQAANDHPKVDPPQSSDPPRAYTPPASSGGDRVQVKGYTRKDGTYVPPHTRSKPRR